ncbi:MAG: hypothetical protein EHM38_04885 [Geobacteraceae bacterium]|jgi:hypothetical protein|nr:MAG: hypothetical protein EHM38_04885 [Geobacteraceae bacterium]
MSKLSGEFKAVWNGIQLILSEKEYDIAMSHVEHMRQVAADKKYYQDPEVGEEDEDYIEPDEYDEPEGWKLSDTLYEVLRMARTQKNCEGIPAADIIKKGLKKLSEGLRGIDPCSDDDADDVF